MSSADSPRVSSSPQEVRRKNFTDRLRGYDHCEVRAGQNVAKRAVSRAAAIAERAGSEDASVRDVEYIRMFAKVAQVQFQAVLDALNEQVSRLVRCPQPPGLSSRT
jgi:hypothetical protein